MRVVLVNIIVFLLPFFGYWAYALLKRDNQGGGFRLDEMPVVPLIAAGTGLVLAVLFTFASTSTGGTEGRYEPPVFRNGKIEPAHSR